MGKGNEDRKQTLALGGGSWIPSLPPSSLLPSLLLPSALSAASGAERSLAGGSLCPPARLSVCLVCLARSLPPSLALALPACLPASLRLRRRRRCLCELALPSLLTIRNPRGERARSTPGLVVPVRPLRARCGRGRSGCSDGAARSGRCAGVSLARMSPVLSRTADPPQGLGTFPAFRGPYSGLWLRQGCGW